jgi:chromate reductase
MAVRVAAIAGSLRAGSFNRLLLRNAIERAPDGLVIEPVEIRAFPVYDGDLEAEAFPSVVTAAKERIRATDALLLVTPEYNYGVPGPLKNAIDWLSRPSGDPTLRGRPVGTMGASTGWAGTVRAQLAWMNSWRFLHMPAFKDAELHVSMARDAFDEQGRLVNELHLQNLDTYLRLFRDWVERMKVLSAED